MGERAIVWPEVRTARVSIEHGHDAFDVTGMPETEENDPYVEARLMSTGTFTVSVRLTPTDARAFAAALAEAAETVEPLARVNE